MKTESIFHPAAVLIALAALLTACMPPEAPAGGSQHTVVFGSHTGLDGTWVKQTSEAQNSNPGATTYTYTDTWTFSGTDVLRKQEYTNYSDETSDSTYYYRGTAVYRDSDGMVISTMSESSTDGEEWTTMESPYTNYDRNLVIDGKWYTTATIRIGNGSGINGTWETTPLSQNEDLLKARYSFTVGEGTMEVRTYYAEEDGGIGATTGSPYTGTFTWDGTTLTSGPTTIACPMLPGGYLDMPSDPHGSRVFTKQ